MAGQLVSNRMRQLSPTARCEILNLVSTLCSIFWKHKEVQLRV